MREQRFFIRIPKSGGGWDYIEIDRERFDPIAIQCLYSREKNPKAPSGRFVPFFDTAASGAKPHLEIDSLEKMIAESISNWIGFLESIGGAEDLITVVKKLDFSSPIRLIADWDAEQAEKKLEELLSSIIFATVSQSAKIKELTEKAGRLSSTLEATETIQDDFYVKWGGAAEEVVFTAEKISRLETAIRELLEEVNRNMGYCRQLLKDSATDMGFLNGDASNDGFLIVAFSFLRNRTAHEPAYVKQLLAKAKSVIKKYASAKKQLDEVWEKNFNGRKIQLLETQKEAEKLLFSLENAAGTMIGCRKMLGEGTARPYDEGISLIDKASFEKAEELISDFHWSPSERKRKINELIISALALLEPPTIPTDISEALTKTETQIVKLESLLGEKKVEQETISPLIQSSNQNEKLYEMALAVGGATACSYFQMSVTTPQTIFDVLCILGKCDRDNKGFLSYLSEKIKEDSEEISDQKKVCSRWKESGKTWVAFYPNGYRIKLAQKKLSLARSFLKKHGLDEAAVKNAAKKRKGKGEDALSKILKNA